MRFKGDTRPVVPDDDVTTLDFRFHWKLRFNYLFSKFSFNASTFHKSLQPSLSRSSNDELNIPGNGKIDFIQERHLDE
ncbi:MAG: hypothetical protein AAGC68_16880, partial [Verrucomicrobiota bacterium]